MVPGGNIKRINALIIGCGSIGSNAAHLLASMGVEQMTLVDGDEVGDENIGPAYFSAMSTGQGKVHVLYDMLETDVNPSIHCYPVEEHLNESIELPDSPYNLIVVGTDNMESRRLAWDRRNEFINPNDGAIWVEGRMGGPQLSMYSFWTHDEWATGEYRRLLFDGAPPPPLPCGMKATAALTKGYVPGFIGQILFNVVNDRLPPYMQMKDLGDGIHISVNSQGDDEFEFDRIALDVEN